MLNIGRSGRVSTSTGRGSASSSTPGTASSSTPATDIWTTSPTTPVAPPFPSSSPLSTWMFP
ncbi:hypothetical protein Taro_004062 [Colocasia esculenta]|uniref:Uncharacterized protein n=1 Tax=Colocasia esculenta TaxID=4460 RepID=A0A843TNF5_COLES|nr:hypothetical protein [Colocasia esculenta]